MESLKRIRESRGLTPTQLAAQAGVSLGTLSRIEGGKPVSRQKIALVLNFLGVNFEEVSGLNVIGEGQEGQK